MVPERKMNGTSGIFWRAIFQRGQAVELRHGEIAKYEVDTSAVQFLWYNRPCLDLPDGAFESA